MAYPKNIIPEPVRRLDFSGINGTFTDLGTPFDSPVRVLTKFERLPLRWLDLIQKLVYLATGERELGG